MRYPKGALTFEQQLDLLRDRGLVISDPSRALHWLRNVSYYRLSAYMLPFKDGESFRPGTEFDAVAGLYIFDRKLRLLVLDAIERVEVAIRTAITYEIAHMYGPFGHTDPAKFASSFDHVRFMDELSEEEQRARETFAAHFRSKYTAEAHLPVWMATELLSFGSVSRLYRALDPVVKRRIADPFQVGDQFLASWLHCLSYVRNVCAHHKRLWNRQLGIKPKLPSRSLAWPHLLTDNSQLYAALVILQHMLEVVAPRCQWKARLFSLFDAHPHVPLASMGMSPDWRTKSTWR